MFIHIRGKCCVYFLFWPLITCNEVNQTWFLICYNLIGQSWSTQPIQEVNQKQILRSPKDTVGKFKCVLTDGCR